MSRWEATTIQLFPKVWGKPRYIVSSVPAQISQMTGPQDASIHSPMAAKGKKAASVTLTTRQGTGIRSKRQRATS